MARYKDTIIRNDRNSLRYLSTEDYPTFAKKDTDVLITGRYGIRMDNLANQYYGSPSLWWIIARANIELFDGGLSLKVGKEYRIPIDLDELGEEFITSAGSVGSVSSGGGVSGGSSGGSSGGGGGAL